MKHLFLFLLFLIPVLLSAQDPLPANPRKLRLGYQTDGEGIVLYGSGVPSYTPTRYRSAFHYMDTTNNIYYQYNRIEAKWDTILAGAGAVADGVSVDNSTWSKIGGTDVQQALTKTDSVLNNITIDGNQIQNKFEATTTTLTVSADTLERNQNYVISTRNNADTFRIVLPQISSTLRGKTLTVVDSTVSVGQTYIEVDTTGGASPIKLRLSNGRLAERYYPHNKTVRITQTDGIWAIDEAISDVVRIQNVTDFYNKRFHRGQVIELGNTKYDVVTATSLSIDSIFVFPIKDASVWSYALGSDLATATTDSIVETRVSDAAFPGQGVWRITTPYNFPTDENAQRFGGSTTSLSPNQRTTVSFWYRLGDSPANNSASVIMDAGNPSRSQEGPVEVIDTTVRGWQYVELPHTLTSIVGISSTPNLYFNIDSDDTVYIASAQWTPTDVSFDRRAGSLSSSTDQLYAVMRTPGKKITFSQVVSGKAITEDSLVNYVIDYCKNEFGPSQCNTVVIDKDLGMNRTLYIPEDMAVISENPEKYTTSITFDLNDTTKNAVQFWRDVSTDYTRRISFSGFDLYARSKCRAMVETQKGIDQRVSYIRIQGEGSTTVLDSLFKYGISTAEGGGPDGLDNTFDKITVEDAYEYAFYMKDIKLTNCIDFRAVRCGRGLYHDGSDLYIVSPWIERQYSSGMVLRGFQYTITDVYFEGIGDWDELGYAEQDTNGVYCIDIANAISASIPDAVITGNAAADIDAYIKARNSRLIYSNPRLTQSGDRAPLLDADCTNNITLINVNYTNEVTNPDFVCQDRLTIINSSISGVAGGDSGKLIRTKITKSTADSSWVINSNHLNPFSIDTLNYEKKVQIQAKGENLIGFSEPFLNTVNGWLDLGELDLTDGTSDVPDFPHPSIEKVARLEFLNVEPFNEYPLRYSDATLEEGKYYLVSCWVRPGNRAIYQVGFDPSGDDYERGDYVVDVPDTTDWSRVFIEVYLDHPLLNSNHNFLFYTNGTATADTAYATGFQIIELDGPLNGVDYQPEYIRTTGTVIDDPTLIEIELLDTMHYTGLKIKIDSSQLVTVRDSEGNLPTAGDIPIANADSTWSWGLSPAFDGGSLYITDADPDTLDFSASGGIYQQIQDLQATDLDNFTSLSDSLIYGRSLTRPFTLNFSMTVEGDTGSTFYNLEVKRNGTAITGCRVSEEYPSAGVEQNISGSCRVDLGDSDALTLEIMTPSASSQVIVRKANLTVR